MMEIEKSIVHILDCEHNTYVPSASCMEELQEDIYKMIEGKANKVFASNKKKSAYFKEGSILQHVIENYKTQIMNFEELSEKVAKHLFDQKMKYGVYEGSDLIISIVVNEGRRYLLLLDNGYQKGITHHLTQTDAVYNEIIPYKTLLSSNLTNKDRAALIELSDLSIHCVENKIDIEAQKVNFMAELVLQCSTQVSYQEAMKTITKTVEDMKEKYDIQEVNLVPKMKSIIKDNVEQQERIDVAKVAEILFADQPLAKADFKEKVKEQGVEKPIDVEYIKSRRSEKVQKIKTDNGIEIIIPVDYMDSKEYVEFITQSDGTISIQLKNIAHITSK